ncbi:MAG: DUF3524 domain-containing protein [Chloroflexi bacterium]|nr:DUF3524 domain-containing protein [Chloroflexota bacterium]
MNITLLSPYHGGSHKAWAAGYTAVSHHNITLLSMPDRFWKWRMHGGAITLGRRFLEQAIEADLILATDMLDLTTFLALTRAKTSNTPAILYMHENQLTYPLPADGATGPMRRQLGERDRHYAFINFASMLAADQVLFNSDYHLTSFLQELPNFLKHFPEYNELGTIQALQKKSAILPVGVDFQRLTHHTAQTDNDIPLILWNQRWEYDKNPEAFFELLYHLADEGVPFRLALCGQQYGKRPLIFTQALEKLADHIIHVGHADADLYQSLLWQADVTISTAHHEFFGISILEAIYCHTFPILPNRLSYPELIPSAYHDHCLYHNKESLIERTKWVLSQRQQSQKIAGELATAVSRYDWTKVAKKYDNFFANFTRHKH